MLQLFSRLRLLAETEGVHCTKRDNGQQWDCPAMHRITGTRRPSGCPAFPRSFRHSLYPSTLAPSGTEKSHTRYRVYPRKHHTPDACARIVRTHPHAHAAEFFVQTIPPLSRIDATLDASLAVSSPLGAVPPALARCTKRRRCSTPAATKGSWCGTRIPVSRTLVCCVVWVTLSSGNGLRKMRTASRGFSTHHLTNFSVKH